MLKTIETGIILLKYQVADEEKIKMDPQTSTDFIGL